MLKIIDQHDEGEYTIKIYEDGSTEKYLKSTGTPQAPIATTQPTLEDKVNYLYYKATGVI